MAKPIFLKNTTGLAIDLTAFGINIPAGGSRDVSTIPSAFLRNDSFLESKITSGDIVINDGTEDIVAANGYIFPDEPLSYIDNDITFNPFIGGKERLFIPGGTTADRPIVPNLGDMRVNTDISTSAVIEVYDGSSWRQQYKWDAIQTDSGTIIPNEPEEILQIFGTGGVFVSASGNTITIDGSSISIPTTITVKDEGIDLSNTPHAELNFLGAGVVATDGGSGVANITVAGSSLTIKDESTTVPNTPHMVLNFIGSPVTVTDGGAGEALVTIDDPSLIIKDESTNVTNTPHTSLNFLGTGVTVADGGSGVANVTITSGGGSSVTIQDEGVGLPGAPHTTLNYVGGGVTATNAGGGVATITIPTSSLTIKDEGVNVANTPHTEIDFVGGVTATDGGSGVATVTIPVFGTEFQKSESLTVSTTTSTTFQNKITLTTPSIPAGEYRVGFHYSWNHNATDTDFEAQFLEDASPMGEIHKQEPKDSGGTFGTTGTSQRHVASKVFYPTLTLGVHTFELDYRTDSAGDESSIWDAVIEIWRVS